MIDFISSTVSATGGANGSGLSGLDMITSIQILLVQDYDDQLKSMGNQIKGITKCKQAYRQDIEALQNLQLKKVIGDNKDKISLSEDEFNHILNGNYLHQADPATGKLTTEDPPQKDPTLDKSEGTEKKHYDQKNGKQVYSHSTYTVRKEVVDTKIEQLKQKLDTLNEQSELNSLSLQSLANQRKVAFETISNLINKEHEGIATIVRNIKS